MKEKKKECAIQRRRRRRRKQKLVFELMNSPSGKASPRSRLKRAWWKEAEEFEVVLLTSDFCLSVFCSCLARSASSSSSMLGSLISFVFAERERETEREHRKIEVVGPGPSSTVWGPQWRK